jgi:hypothetical protein
VRTGVARPELGRFSGSHEAAAPHVRSPERAVASCAAVIHAPAVSAGTFSHDRLSPRRVRRIEACPGGA